MGPVSDILVTTATYSMLGSLCSTPFDTLAAAWAFVTTLLATCPVEPVPPIDVVWVLLVRLSAKPRDFSIEQSETRVRGT